MWMTIAECHAEAEKLDDSLELAAKLREVAASTGLQHTHAYYLREAACNLAAQFELVRALLGRLAQAPGLQQAAAHEAVAQRGGNSAVPRMARRLPDDGSNNSRLLDLPRVLDLAGIGRTYWFKAIKEGAAPKPIRIGKRTFWRQADIEHWVADKAQQRDATT